MPYCGEKCVSRHDGRDQVAIALKCRSWLCPDCAPKRQRQLIAKALSGCPSKLITLTSRRSADISAEQAARELVRAWRLIRRLIKRIQHKEPPQFLAIFEQTKLGWPHLHILARCEYIDQHWLSSQMQRLTKSPVVDIRTVRSRRGAAKYVAKYTAKGPGKFGTLKRYWTSQAYEDKSTRPERSKQTWDLQSISLQRWAAAFIENEWTIEWLSATQARATPPP